ncbi:hypothetical protein Ciccas_011449 [Cichlidogyrus casuarinus]|uniref:RRM domain-containing protein n=1 Tax=Cichlidogyrus casuarinus TaxID=1844966 RepID=A0ABD2PSH1_9PLAT
MSGLSRFIIVSGLAENATHNDFFHMCAEFGAIRACRIQRSDKGYVSGFCEFEVPESATAAVQMLNARSQADGLKMRASFSKARTQNIQTQAKSAQLRVKFLPRSLGDKEVWAEFSRFGNLSRVKVIPYERHATAHLTYDSMESAEMARSSMNNQRWANDPEQQPMLVEYNNSYYPCPARKSLPPNDEEAYGHGASMEQADTSYYATGLYNYPAQQQPQFDMQQPLMQNGEYPPSSKAAQYVQVNAYPWTSTAGQQGVYENGVGAGANGKQEQLAHFYNQLLHQFQNTHLYQTSPMVPGSSFAQQQQPLLLGPQSMYSAPPAYPLLFNNACFSRPQPQFRYGATHFRAPTYQQRPPPQGGPRNGNTLYIYNTGNNMTEDGLKALFGRFGTITDVSVPRDPTTGASRNFGFVNYLESGAASAAIEQMNGFLLFDRTLQVSYKRARLSAAPSSSSSAQAAKNGKEANNNGTCSEQPETVTAADTDSIQTQNNNNNNE